LDIKLIARANIVINPTARDAVKRRMSPWDGAIRCRAPEAIEIPQVVSARELIVFEYGDERAPYDRDE